jgi:hypothetical protein
MRMACRCSGRPATASAHTARPCALPPPRVFGVPARSADRSASVSVWQCARGAPRSLVVRRASAQDDAAGDFADDADAPPEVRPCSRLFPLPMTHDMYVSGTDVALTPPHPSPPTHSLSKLGPTFHCLRPAHPPVAWPTSPTRPTTRRYDAAPVRVLWGWVTPSAWNRHVSRPHARPWPLHSGRSNASVRIIWVGEDVFSVQARPSRTPPSGRTQCDLGHVSMPCPCRAGRRVRRSFPRSLSL